MSSVTIEGARLVFRNFKGETSKYNRDGRREFSVVLPREIAKAMKKDGWNVKDFKSALDEGDEPESYVTVAIGNKGRPPRMVLINSKGQMNIDPDDCDIFDWVDIAKADLIINPYNWEMDGKTGIKAYLKSLFVTINEDELERKYADVPVVDESDAEPFATENNGPGVVDEEVPF